MDATIDRFITCPSAFCSSYTSTPSGGPGGVVHVLEAVGVFGTVKEVDLEAVREWMEGAEGEGDGEGGEGHEKRAKRKTKWGHSRVTNAGVSRLGSILLDQGRVENVDGDVQPTQSGKVPENGECPREMPSRDIPETDRGQRSTGRNAESRYSRVFQGRIQCGSIGDSRKKRQCNESQSGMPPDGGRNRRAGVGVVVMQTRTQFALIDRERLQLREEDRLPFRNERLEREVAINFEVLERASGA